MVKYHIDRNGKPAVCRAHKRPCPLGGDDVHFDTLEEAQEHADRVNKEQFGLLGNMEPEVEKYVYEDAAANLFPEFVGEKGEDNVKGAPGESLEEYISKRMEYVLYAQDDEWLEENYPADFTKNPYWNIHFFASDTVGKRNYTDVKIMTAEEYAEKMGLEVDDLQTSSIFYPDDHELILDNIGYSGHFERRYLETPGKNRIKPEYELSALGFLQLWNSNEEPKGVMRIKTRSGDYDDIVLSRSQYYLMASNGTRYDDVMQYRYRSKTEDRTLESMIDRGREYYEQAKDLEITKGAASSCKNFREMGEFGPKINSKGELDLNEYGIMLAKKSNKISDDEGLQLARRSLKWSGIVPERARILRLENSKEDTDDMKVLEVDYGLAVMSGTMPQTIGAVNRIMGDKSTFYMVDSNGEKVKIRDADLILFGNQKKFRKRGLSGITESRDDWGSNFFGNNMRGTYRWIKHFEDEVAKGKEIDWDKLAEESLRDN